MPEDLETFLQHHGVKGMKWGVRRTPEQLGHRPSGKKRKSSSKKSTAAKKKKIKRKLSGLRKKKTVKKTVKSFRKAESYTDDDLARAVRRLQLEKQYNQLISEVTAKKKSKGQKFVETTLKEVVAEPLKKSAKEALEKELRKAIEDTERRRRQS